MYKEYRDVSKSGAISQMYSEMAGRHRARSNCIHIIRIQEIEPSKCVRSHMIELLKKKLRFPAVRNMSKLNRRFRHTFMVKAPTTF